MQEKNAKFFVFFGLSCRGREKRVNSFQENVMIRQAKEATVLNIQKTAIDLFGQKKYRDISMNEIARLSRITKGTLYKYYPSKIALFVSIFENHLQRFIEEELRMNYAGLSYQDTLATMFRRLYEYTRDNRGFMRLFWMLNSDTVEGELPQELLQRIQELNTTLIEITARCLEGKKCTGLFGACHPALVTHLFSAMNKGLHMQIDKETGLDIGGVSGDALFELMQKVLVTCAEMGAAPATATPGG
jgi:AcrR family transcriptional regulator